MRLHQLRARVEETQKHIATGMKWARYAKATGASAAVVRTWVENSRVLNRELRRRLHDLKSYGFAPLTPEQKKHQADLQAKRELNGYRSVSHCANCDLLYEDRCECGYSGRRW